METVSHVSVDIWGVAEVVLELLEETKDVVLELVVCEVTLEEEEDD